MVAKSSSEARRILRGFQWTYASVALQGFLKLAALMVLARLLTPRDFGLLGFALLCTNFIERIGQGGIAPALVQVKNTTPDIISSAWWMSLTLGLLSTITIVLCADSVARFFQEPQLATIIRVISVGCLLEALAAIPEALLQRELRCREIMLADNLAYFIGMVGVCTTLAFTGCGVWSLVFAQIALKAVRLIVIVGAAPNFEKSSISLDYVRYLIRMSFGFSLGRLLNFFSLQGDNFVVGRLLGTEALGMYNRAYQLMTLPAMYFGQVFERVMFPAMARKQNDRQQIAAEFLVALEMLTLVALPSGMVMYSLASEIVLFGFGEHWRGVIPVVSILSFGVFFRTAYKCSDTAVRSVGAVYHYAGRQAVYSALVIGGAFVGALVAGVPGVACGVVGAVALNYVSMTRLAMKLIGVQISHVVRAHLVGCWASIWVVVSLLLSTPFLRAHLQQPAVVLLGASACAVLAWCISISLAATCVPFGSMRYLRMFCKNHFATVFTKKPSHK